MSDDLVAFLRARLDEDEQTARTAGNRHWLVQDNIIELYPEREDDGFMSWPTRSDAQHAARHDPARVLRDVEAKRQIVDMYAAALEERTTVRSRMREVIDRDRDEFGRLHQHESDLIERARILAPTVHTLATVYADHPDYPKDQQA